jgi:hypothetical protein
LARGCFFILDVLWLCWRLCDSERYDPLTNHAGVRWRILPDHKALLRTLGDLHRLDGSYKPLRAHEVNRLEPHTPLYIWSENGSSIPRSRRPASILPRLRRESALLG